MKVSEKDGDGKEEYIPRLSHEQADQLDDFGGEHEDELSKHSVKLKL